jgi:beta-glucanase (GH16 family)
LMAAALEYPQFAEILNDAGERIGVGKHLGTGISSTPSQQQNKLETQVEPTKETRPNISNTPSQQQQETDASSSPSPTSASSSPSPTSASSAPSPITFPMTVILPSGSSLVDPVTPIN